MEWQVGLKPVNARYRSYIVSLSGSRLGISTLAPNGSELPVSIYAALRHKYDEPLEINSLCVAREIIDVNVYGKNDQPLLRINEEATGLFLP